VIVVTADRANEQRGDEKRKESLEHVLHKNGRMEIVLNPAEASSEFKKENGQKPQRVNVCCRRVGNGYNSHK
jgi:hypothetical protein